MRNGRIIEKVQYAINEYFALGIGAPLDLKELDWSSNNLQHLPDDFDKRTALEKLNLSQRSAYANVWSGPCVAVGCVRAAEWHKVLDSRLDRQSGGLFQKNFAQGSGY